MRVIVEVEVDSKNKLRLSDSRSVTIAKEMQNVLEQVTIPSVSVCMYTHIGMKTFGTEELHTLSIPFNCDEGAGLLGVSVKCPKKYLNLHLSPSHVSE